MFASPPHTLPSNFKVLFSSRNILRALNDATVLPAGRCHVGHKSSNRQHTHGSACTLVAAKQDVALYTSISVCSISDTRSEYCCRTVYSTDPQPADIYGMTHRWGRRHVHSGKYNITEESGTQIQLNSTHTVHYHHKQSRHLLLQLLERHQELYDVVDVQIGWKRQTHT